MRIAIQITGGLRSFKSCLPTILKAILFEQNPEVYDVFLLLDRQEGENYSTENEKLLRDMFRDRIKVLRYADEFDEEAYIRRDFPQIREWVESKGLYLDRFVHKLWARRYIVNTLRLAYERSNGRYDIVIRTRLDIYLKGNIKHLLVLPFPKKVVYAGIDIMSIGDADTIDCESSLGFLFPTLPREPINYEDGRMWLLSSEHQLSCYLIRNGIEIRDCGMHGGGIRRLHMEKLDELIKDLEDMEGLTILYGHEGNYLDVTKAYMSEDNEYKYASFPAAFGDPFPGKRKHVIVRHHKIGEVRIEE